jgi:hypothetical protein
MGVYIYRVTGELIKLTDGRKAHVAKYAYKPFMSGFGNAEKANARMHFKSGCTASANLKLKSDLLATLYEDKATGKITGELYYNACNARVFYDDTTFGSEKMPRLGSVAKSGKTYDFTPKEVK